MTAQVGNPETDSVYEDMLESLYCSNSGAWVSNGKPAHATALYKLFFRKASERVRIFCQDLSAEVFNDEALRDELIQALRRGVRVEVAIQRPNPDESLVYKLFRERGGRELAGHFVVTSCCNVPTLASHPANFAVMDSRAYRLEEDKNQLKASAKLNDSSGARVLIEAFESILRVSQPVVV